MPLINPSLSIITPSLNTGKYLRDTLETISKQNYKDFEHIIVDGGSTDETISILNSQSQAKWISRIESSDFTITETFREGYNISSGRYIMQCCISDGYLDQDWFRICVEYLDANPDISLVYGLPQNLNPDDTFGRVVYHDFFDSPPPVGQEELAFLLATGFLYPEGNFCVRRNVFDSCFSTNSKDDEFRTHPALGFMYQFIIQGYKAKFIPRIANYGRLHNSRQFWNRGNEKPIETLYFQRLKKYAWDIFLKNKKHTFKNGYGQIIGVVDISEFRFHLVKQLLLNLKIVRLSPYVIANKSIDRLNSYIEYTRLRIKNSFKKFLISFPRLYEFMLRIAQKPFDELYVARLLIKKDAVVFDIGANIGQFTILFSSLVGQKGKVYAFEPVHETYSFLIKNLKSWRLRDNIKESQIALSDRNSEAIIYTPIGDLTQSSLAQHTDSTSWIDGLKKRKIQCQKVKLMTIDSFMEENLIERVDYIKCDVEGAEFSVIKGAEKLLSRIDRPIILLEFFPAWAQDFGYNALDIFSFLRSTGGYSVFHVQGKKIKEVTDFSAEMPGTFPNSLNYLCLPSQIDPKVLELLGINRNP